MQKLRLLFCLLCLYAPSSHGDRLIQINDLQTEFKQAASKNLPLLVLFSSLDCEYCEYIKENFLIPMNRSRAYSNKVIIRELKTESFFDLVDATGSKVSADMVALRYGADVTPTILFLDSTGQELSEKIVGLVTRDYFDRLLDDGINEALVKLQ